VHPLLQVRLPAAAGALFVGLQVASVFALVGCVVMEFINATQGAGFLIVNASNTLDTATSMATMVVLGLLGLVASVGVQALRARVVFWDRHADVVGVVQKGGAL
jgi:NitT/TauT family transport system permease protein